MTIPEGLEFDEELGGKFLEIVNNTELGTAERANALLELQAESLRTASEKISEVWKDTREGWVQEAKQHPDFGGEKFDETMGSISKLLDEFGSQELREEVFDLTGAGDHPKMIEFLAKVAKAVEEGTPISGNPGNSAPSTANKLYPSMKG